MDKECGKRKGCSNSMISFNGKSIPFRFLPMTFPLLVLLLVFSSANLYGAIASAVFTSPVFRPSEVTPVQATQAEIQILLDGDEGRYRLSVFRSVTGELIRFREVTHSHPLGTAQKHTVSAPLNEGNNQFYVTVRDITTDSSTASVTTPDTPVITRDTRTKLYSVSLDSLSP